MIATTPQLNELSRIIAESRKAALANVQTFPAATSPAQPAEIYHTKTAEESAPAESPAPDPAILPMTTVTNKTSDPMQTKSDQYFPIIIQPGSGTTTPTDPNAPTPEQKTNRMMMWGFGILVFLIVMIWLMNRKTA